MDIVTGLLYMVVVFMLVVVSCRMTDRIFELMDGRCEDEGDDVCRVEEALPKNEETHE